MAYKFQVGPAQLSGALTQEGTIEVRDQSGALVAHATDAGELSASADLKAGGALPELCRYHRVTQLLVMLLVILLSSLLMFHLHYFHLMIEFLVLVLILKDGEIFTLVPLLVLNFLVLLNSIFKMVLVLLISHLIILQM